MKPKKHRCRYEKRMDTGGSYQDGKKKVNFFIDVMRCKCGKIKKERKP